MQPTPQRLVVQIPGEGRDRPVWTRVGVIAVLGFVIGIAWPKLAGFQLGPSPPDDDHRAAASGSAEADEAAPGASSAAPAASSAAVAAKGPEPVQVQTVVVKATDVLSCRDAKGKTVDKCDRPDFDTLLVPRMQELARCPSAAGLSGKLSIGFEFDFKRNRVQVVRGKTTTIPRSTVSGIWECATKAVSGAALEGMKHEHERYTVFYATNFYPPGHVIDDAALAGALEAPEDKGGKEETSEPILGTAQVVYDTVLVRDEPKTGNVVARLVRGTRVELLSRKGSWYRIKFNDREGWVYRGSIAQ